MYEFNGQLYSVVLILGNFLHNISIGKYWVDFKTDLQNLHNFLQDLLLFWFYMKFIINVYSQKYLVENYMTFLTTLVEKIKC